MIDGDFTVWTDGSKKDEMGSSGVLWKEQESIRMNTFAQRYFPIFSSFESETCAIRDGLVELNKQQDLKNSRVVVFTDSQSILKHLVSLGMKPRPVSNLVSELVSVIHELVNGMNVFLHFCWIPGHEEIGLNDEVDLIAKLALENEESETIQLSLPRTRIRRYNKSLTRQDLKHYLKNSIENSHWQNYPPRQFFKKPHESDGDNRSVDVGVFRMRTGHNRLRIHLHNIGLEESNLCRLCNRSQEDCYHLLVECEGILVKLGSKMMRLRVECGVLDREEYYQWLFQDDDLVSSQRKKFVNLLKTVDIVL